MPRAHPDWTDPLIVRRVRIAGDADPDFGAWPGRIPAVRQVLTDGLDLAKLTILVGENGSGKSTLIEAIAMAFGLPGEGGSTGAMHKTYSSESPLSEWLTLERGAGASKWGYFLRAETTHGLFTYLHNNPGPYDPDFHALSHGESFLTMIGTRRFRGPGFFVMDEPEAGLSFSAQLALVGTLHALAADRGNQMLLATHSPVLASIPGAHILQLDEHGLRESRWEQLESVINYTNFLAEPRRYLRHVVDL
ncbi:MAG: AAA family ATPase [Actinobacteria bacterium]|uniref:AAA family ATPase n=1 Tax=Nostocoides veronense TaxID=330836 RepID=A0ABN2L9R7_9MICO|nr:AAA family ATPase [Actinomycetota bacterium]